MTGTTSQVVVCNLALANIGARGQISSINPSDGSTEANYCSLYFQPTFEQLARTARWGCLRKQVAATLYAAAQGTPENPNGTTLPLPPVPWLYAYLLPADNLALRYIVPSLPAGTPSGTPPQTTASNPAITLLPGYEQIPFAPAVMVDANGNNLEVFLCNQDQAQIVYTANIANPAFWDSLFQQAMVSSMAAYLVPALTLNLQLGQMQMMIAEQKIAAARAADGNEGVTVMDHLPDFMQARAGAGAYNTYPFITPFGVYGGVYQNMVWPGAYSS